MWSFGSVEGGKKVSSLELKVSSTTKIKTEIRKVLVSMHPAWQGGLHPSSPL